MDISTADLRSFITVVDLGSFSEAAVALHISQPALTRRVQRLEEQLGVQLLDRSTRQISLSVVGRDFITRARYLIDELDSSLLSVRDIAERTSGQVTVACIPTAAFFFLPEVIREFSNEFPRIRVRIIDEGANLVLRSVLQGEADLGINLIGNEEADIDFEPMLSEPFVLACLPDHPLADRRQIRWEELSPYRLITAARTSGNRLLLDQKLAGVAGRPRSLYEVQHLTTSLGMVQSGLGVAALPSMALPRARSSPLISRPLIDPVIERTVGIIRRRGTTLSPAAAEFHAMLKTRWRDIAD